MSLMGLFTVLFLVVFITYDATASLLSRNIFDSSNNLLKQEDKNAHCPAVRRISSIRGGSTAKFDLNELIKKSEQAPEISLKTEVLVITSLGSAFLDKKKKLTMNKNSTISELKQQLCSKFPGSPPVALQRLFYSSRLLNDTEAIGNISSLSPLPIVLDMISGTSSYNRTLSIAQSIEAYVSTIVHQAYLGAKLQEVYKHNIADESGSVATNLESKYYTDMLKSLKNNIYEQYKEDIKEALETEREPDIASEDTKAWRSSDSRSGTIGAALSPLTAALVKEFDLNWRGVRHFTYYSLVLASFAYFSASTSTSSSMLVALIPVLWLSKLRQLRLLYKLVLYAALPLLYESEFLRPLLPAPLQVIGERCSAGIWETDDSTNVDGSPRRSWKKSVWKGAKNYGFPGVRKIMRKRKKPKHTSAAAVGTLVDEMKPDSRAERAPVVGQRELQQMLDGVSEYDAVASYALSKEEEDADALQEDEVEQHQEEEEEDEDALQEDEVEQHQEEEEEDEDALQEDEVEQHQEEEEDADALQEDEVEQPQEEEEDADALQEDEVEQHQEEEEDADALQEDEVEQHLNEEDDAALQEDEAEHADVLQEVEQHLDEENIKDAQRGEELKQQHEEGESVLHKGNSAEYGEEEEGDGTEYGEEVVDSAEYEEEEGDSAEYGIGEGDSAEYEEEEGDSAEYGEEEGDSAEYGEEEGDSPEYGEQEGDSPKYGEEEGDSAEYGEEDGDSPEYGEEEDYFEAAADDEEIHGEESRAAEEFDES